jgi:hypothetical protein
MAANEMKEYAILPKEKPIEAYAFRFYYMPISIFKPCHLSMISFSYTCAIFVLFTIIMVLDDFYEMSLLEYVESGIHAMTYKNINLDIGLPIHIPLDYHT